VKIQLLKPSTFLLIKKFLINDTEYVTVELLSPEAEATHRQKVIQDRLNRKRKGPGHHHSGGRGRGRGRGRGGRGGKRSKH